MAEEPTGPSNANLEKRKYPRREFPAPITLTTYDGIPHEGTIGNVSISGVLANLDAIIHPDDDFEFERGMLVNVTIPRLCVSNERSKVVRAEQASGGTHVAIQFDDINLQISERLIAKSLRF